MRHSASVTAMSWIPSEAISGLAKLPFEAGVAHYDQPLPASIGGPGTSLEERRAADRFRLAEGDVLVRQGEEGDDIFLLLDGVLSVGVDGRELGQLGPGTVLGGRAGREEVRGG